MKRTTEWTCDICEDISIVESGREDDGTSMPYNWKSATVTFKFGEYDPSERIIISCDQCYYTFRKMDFRDKRSREELKKPFWKKLLMGCE